MIRLKNRTIAVIGLGYVGLPLAVEFGKHRPVIGYDTNVARISDLNARLDSTLEVSEEELREARFLTFTAEVRAIQSAQIFIVTVPTPVDKVNRPDLAALIRASEIVGSVLKPGDVVIYESTVYPGATEEVCVPILERGSNLKYQTEDICIDISQSDKFAGFYAAYSPERINPGDSAHRLSAVKKVTSGSTPAIANAVDALYREIILAGTHKATSIKIAEAAKVIENAQRDLNIAFVNELSMIFNCMGIDTREVLSAAATKWNFIDFKPGLVGGHCIGVDPYYLTYKAQELGYQPQVILSGRRINDGMAKYAAQNVVRLMIKSGIDVGQATVGVMGVTFKENCPDVRNSKVIDLVRELNFWGLKVKVMDPWANKNALASEYGLHLSEITKNTEFDSLIVAVGHRQYLNITPSELRALCLAQRKPVIADLKCLYDRAALAASGFEVFRL
jgi:UDP-N-acetyl-D-galactosamine dehydrogenase